MLDAHPTSSITAARRKFSLGADARPSNTLTVNGVRLRPFVAGRKLPHRAEFASGLVEQQAQLASESQTSLAGVVTESSAIQPDAPTYVSQTAYSTSAPRVMPNQPQTVSRQGAAISKRRTQTVRPRGKRSSVALPDQIADGSQSSLGSKISGNWMANEENLRLVAPPIISAAQQAQISHSIQNINPTIFQGERPAESASSAGPPPFPLNLLPQQSLKQFVGGGHSKASAPPSFFGSWHGGHSLIAHNFASTSSLPEAGFQTHMRDQGFGHQHPHQYHGTAAHSYFTATTAATKTSPAKFNSAKTLLAQAHGPSQAEAKIFLYPPYSTAY